jgi:diadenosine tetraphosphatase ApaH/serine/threonine PP2A family protein phosphatase
VRVCVLSDIHGNLHAFDAVLEAIAADSPDEIWCLGDLVGYGPRPNECCRIARERTDLCLVGNHDLAVLERIGLEDFTHDAAVSARWTIRELDDDARAFLEPLEAAGEREGVGLFHASPRDPVWEYVLTPEAAAAGMLAAPTPLTLVGHSHLALAFSLSGTKLAGDLAPDGTEIDLGRAGRRLLNPGSVGQPRDGDPRAAYLVLDLDAGRATFRRVSYPIERTQQEIRERGLPEALAERLENGS